MTSVTPDSTQQDANTARGGPIQVFYSSRRQSRLPQVARADGIYLWDAKGKRYIDASSGPIVCNLGHGNAAVLGAAAKQMQEVAYASRAFFENIPNQQLSELIVELAGPGFDQAFLVSGGSEAVESAVKLARQYAVTKGETERWKVIAREPSYHGGTLGAQALSGDPAARMLFGPLHRSMPAVPAPMIYRLPDGIDAGTRIKQCADALEATICREGPQSVLAFIMEPVGGLATGALVSPDWYYKRVREICDRHGVLLIYDEVMSGAGRSGMFLAAHHWPNARPDLVVLAKGLGAGYTPLGAVLAPNSIVDPVAECGGFMHGFTYSANPLSCAIGRAVVCELMRGQLMLNAEKMGGLLRDRLLRMQASSRIVGDVRGKGLLMAVEIVRDRQTQSMLPENTRAIQRIVELGMEVGILLYSRRTANGRFGEWLMVAPPLIVTADQIDEIVDKLAATLNRYEAELERSRLLPGSG